MLVIGTERGESCCIMGCGTDLYGWSRSMVAWRANETACFLPYRFGSSSALTDSPGVTRGRVGVAMKGRHSDGEDDVDINKSTMNPWHLSFKPLSGIDQDAGTPWLASRASRHWM